MPTPNAPAGPVLFDQHSRYASLAAAVRTMLPDGGSVLDVGSGTSTLLTRYLPKHELTFVDPLLAGRTEPNLLGVSLFDATLSPGTFDVAVCVDVLEHVHEDRRPEFLQRLRTLARKGVVVSAPFRDDESASAVDERIERTYVAKTGRSYPWLKEHAQFGLPDFAATCAELGANDWSVHWFGNGHAPWLAELLPRFIALLDDHGHLPLLHRVSERFIAHLAGFDHLQPSYRRVVVASADATTTPITLADDAATRSAADAAFHEFRCWFDAELAIHADQLLALVRSTRTDDVLRRVEAAARAAQAALAEALARTRTEVSLLKADLKEQRCKLAAAESRAQMLWQLARNHEARITRLLSSFSWRITAPARVAARVPSRILSGVRRATLAGARYSARRLRLPDDVEWRLKTAFFTTLRPFLRSTQEYREYVETARWRTQCAAAFRPTIAPGHPELDDIVMFGIIDWDFRTQRPQHLAREFAIKGHRVLYLAPGFVVAPTPGYAVAQPDPSLPIYEVRLHAAERRLIYSGRPVGALGEQLLEGLRLLLRDTGLRPCTAIVDHPGWVDLARALPRAVVVYDCMDNHHGFSETGAALAQDEHVLVAEADALVVTSSWLLTAMEPLHDCVRLIRNACDPQHFRRDEGASAVSPPGRRTIGYFGALAEWFDAPLLRDVATTLADCEFMLVGADTAGVARALAGLPNVTFVGEVTYAELPTYIRRMDVLVIPFVIDQLTLATNPVKAYEALAAGIPVVATPMPELMETDLAPHVRVAPDAPRFCAAVATALDEADDPVKRAERVAFAAQQSWATRARDFEELVRAPNQPLVGVVVIAWNGCELTRRCVRSVLDDPTSPRVLVTIVDNASTDGTSAWLDEIELDRRVRVIRNPTNDGFARACNQGLRAAAAAGADILVILNNDIVVTPGWLRTIRNHLRRHPDIGLIGPVTNNIGNEARIKTSYATMAEMEAEQASYTGAHAGRMFEIGVLAFFCVAMPRDVHDAVGDLDENFGTGFFEDDDYCQRVRRIGRRIVCAEDVFVHHELSASFAKVDAAARRALFERNRTYYESKWGPWQSHAYRSDTLPAPAPTKGR